MTIESKFLIQETAEFKRWLKSIKNPIARTAVAMRVERARLGNFGDHKSVGDGVYEMRLSTGAGYRIYYAQRGDIIYILLNGGDKSTQQEDINKAKMIWSSLKTQDAANRIKEK